MKMIIANIEGILKHQKEPNRSASSKVGASAKPKPTSNWKRQKMQMENYGMRLKSEQFGVSTSPASHLAEGHGVYWPVDRTG